MKVVKKNLRVLVIFMIVVIVGGCVAGKMYLESRKNGEEKEQEDIVLEEELLFPEEKSLEEEVENFYVDLKGAVVNPGVYEIEQGKKVIDVVNLAGGLTEEADTSLINLAKQVTNEMVIIIYTKEEVKKAMEEEVIVKIVEKECVCPSIQNDACLNQESGQDNSNVGEINGGKVNLNTATVEELQTLPGIRESKAKAIIEYREEHGSFQAIEELQEVSGIGEALFEKVKDYISI